MGEVEGEAKAEGEGEFEREADDGPELGQSSKDRLESV